ncbi:hypothetical protein FRC11_002472, partial [Ceratobasidium sp. 423]
MAFEVLDEERGVPNEGGNSLNYVIKTPTWIKPAVNQYWLYLNVKFEGECWMRDSPYAETLIAKEFNGLGGLPPPSGWCSNKTMVTVTTEVSSCVDYNLLEHHCSNWVTKGVVLDRLPLFHHEEPHLLIGDDQWTIDGAIMYDGLYGSIEDVTMDTDDESVH